MTAVAVFAWLFIVAQDDSQAVLRHAQRAQAEFEWKRRARLPVEPARGTDRCDEPIGRFCYWHDDIQTVPPPEPASIGALRGRLLQALDSAAAAIPGDDWIAGQRVRYLVESGAATAALSAARACRSTAWWCDALAGFALHASGDFPAADSAFAASLRDMPHDERCRWNDLSVLLSGSLRQRYRTLSCEQRAALETRVWWQAQPLLSRSGNDRRTEHFARLTMARLLEHASSPYGASGGADLRELIVRYGWPTSWARAMPNTSGADPVMVGHEREPGYSFLPEASAERPRERYAPSYAAGFTTLAPEFTVFRRGESTLVVAAYDVTRDTLFASHRVAAALVLARGDNDSMVIERRDLAAATGILVAVAPWPARLASLELTAPSRGVARARAELPASDGVAGLALSDPLVFEPLDSLPDDLASVLPHVPGPASVARGTRVGLYWELYGLAPAGETIDVSVGVVSQPTGWLRRIAQSMGLAARARRVRVDWREDVKPWAGMARRVLALDTSRLPPGRYRLEVTVTAAGRAAATSREFRVLP